MWKNISKSTEANPGTYVGDISIREFTLVVQQCGYMLYYIIAL